MLLAGSVWALALPLLVGPDEESHAVRAAALVRGDVIGRKAPEEPGSRLLRTVRVPEAYADAKAASCVLRSPSVLPSCGRDFDGGGSLVDVTTYQYRQPPLYYAVVGLPTLAFPARSGIYLMRIASVALGAAFLASAFASVRWFARPAMVAALFLAFTPEVLFLVSTVTPNGLEAASAICLLATLLVLVRQPGATSGRLVARASIALIVLVNVRGLSPFFAFVCLAAAAALARPGQLRRIAARRDVRAWSLAAAVASVPAVAWTIAVSVKWQVERVGNGLVDAVDSTPRFLRQTVGVFAWRQGGFVEIRELLPPVGLYVLWWACVVVLLGVALAWGRRREVGVLAALIALFVLLPISIDGLNLPSTGYFWEGRHGLPLYSTVVIVAGLLAARAAGEARSPRLRAPSLWFGVVGVVVAAQVLALSTVVRRFGVGGHGSWNPLDFLLAPDWSPGLPPWLSVLLLAASLSALAVCAARDVPAPTPSSASVPRVAMSVAGR